MSENSRIAKNTFFLYLRMGIVLLVKLYVARILLEALGIDDYGVWNLLASFVVSFQFISSPIVTSTQRYLNYDMGQGGKQLTKIFNLSFELIGAVCILLVIGFETVGLWFVENKMNFAPDRASTVFILYQLTILSLVFQMLQKPFESTVVAHEKMSFYAYISLYEALFLLGITLLLKSDISNNKLIWYGVLNLLLYLLEFCGYWIYCRIKFVCCRIRWTWDKALAKDIAVFSGWNLFGGLSSMTANQGINVLLNMFFGVAVNAAFGVSHQVKGAVTLLITNLQKAFDPQIVKSYSLGDTQRMHNLVTAILRSSYLLALALVFPLMYNFEFLLKLWLGNNIPPYTYWFCMLTILQMLFVALGAPVDTAIFATGRIKTYQLWLSGEIFLNIIICYILFKLGFDPVWAFIVRIFVEIVIMSTRFVFLKRVGFRFTTLLQKVLIPLSLITVITCGGCYLTFSLLNLTDGWIKFLSSTTLFLILLGFISWFTILPQPIRIIITEKITAKFNKK